MILANHGIISSSGGLPPSTLLTNLYAVYKAENNANDSLGAYNGTAQGGLTYSTGKSGDAFTFNGSNAYISFPDNSFNSLNGSFSVSGWFKTASSIINTENYILNNSSANSWFNNPNGFEFLQYGNSLRFYIFNNTNTYTTLIAGYTFQTNTWYHVVATKLINGNMNVYLNGALLGTNVTTVNPTYLATVTKPGIGALNYPAKSPSVDYYAQNGFLIDEVGVWNKELTSTEITELYTKYYPY